jgi:hypothetical protein
MPWKCFLIEPAGKTHLHPRRFTFSTNKPCPSGQGFGHNAVTTEPFLTINERVPVRTADPDSNDCYWDSHHDLAPAQNDPRWPGQCVNRGCPYQFAPEDEWQVSPRHLYARVGDPSTTFKEDEIPPGAMFDALWLPWTGPDGKSWSVILPPGGMNNVWHIDGQAASGGHWARTGEAPNITASPSIKSPRYHGFLQNGVLTTDVEGKVFPDEPQTTT